MTIDKKEKMETNEQEETRPKKGETVVVDGGRLVKMEVDYSSTCDEKIPEAQSLAESGKVTEAVESLMTLEKQARTVSISICSDTYSPLRLGQHSADISSPVQKKLIKTN